MTGFGAATRSEGTTRVSAEVRSVNNRHLKVQVRLPRSLSGLESTVENEARRALQALRAAPLEEFGLVLVLRDAVESTVKRADLSLDLDIPELAVPLPPAVEQGVYRIAQEALENVVRHARASRLTVKLACTAADLELSIIDDGLGFSPDTLNGDSNRFGLRGMRERAAMLGGSLQIISQPRQGTQICLRLELK